MHALLATRPTDVVIIGGFDADMDDNTDVVQKFNIDSESGACYLESYPITAGFMEAGFMVDGTVKSCGGEGGENDYDLSDCYDYDPTTNTWSTAPSMSDTRVGMGSSHVEGGLWLLTGGGGYYGGTDETIFSNATSEVWDGDKFVSGPTLYGEYFTMHCQVSLDPTHVFIADGDTGHTWILDWETQEYIQQDSMRPKNRPGCGKIVNRDGAIEVVVASDGTSEIFSFDTMSWRTGPEMPFIGNSFGNDQLGDTFVLVGGRNSGDGTIFDTVYQFDPIHYHWILKPYHLDSPRFDSTLLTVPKDVIQCP